METRRDDFVELTLLMDRKDYRRYFWITDDRGRVFTGSIVAGFMVVLAYWWWIHGELGALVMTAALAAVYLVAPWVRRARRLRRLPAQYFTPYTYRLDSAGVHWIAPHLQLVLPWPSIVSLENLEGWFWRVGNVADGTICIARSTLTNEDDAAIVAVFNRHKTGGDHHALQPNV